MEDTAWFEEQSDDEKLIILAERMWNRTHPQWMGWSEEAFGTLLKFMPVDFVRIHIIFTLGRWNDVLSFLNF